MVPRGARWTWQRYAVTDSESVGTLLRAYRHAAKLTMEELAEASGVSARAISDMERGHSRRPQRRTLKAIIDALGLDPDDERTLLNAAAAARRSLPPGRRGTASCPATSPTSPAGRQKWPAREPWPARAARPGPQSSPW
jgi:transcriptional regulator with XRE-family HTH domain